MKTYAKIFTAFGCSTILSAGGIGVATIANASIPDSSGLIHACYKPTRSGSDAPLNVIDAALPGGSCPSTQKTLTWNQTGPQGPAGPPGLSNVNVVSGSFGPNGGFGTPNTESCPAGQVALSIAFSENSAQIFDTTFSYFPDLNSSGQPVGYTFGESSPNTGYTATVTCAMVGS